MGNETGLGMDWRVKPQNSSGRRKSSCASAASNRPPAMRFASCA